MKRLMLLPRVFVAALALSTTCNAFTTGGNTFTALAQQRSRTALNLFSCNEQENLNNRHSASDWLYNVRSLPQSKVLRDVRNPVLATGIWSLLVSILHRTLRMKAPALASAITIPGTAHSYLVSALGLLLVFRTNSAYQRFNEGRKIWENILSVSRNLTRLIHLYKSEVGESRGSDMRDLVAAYPYLLRQHIRPGCLCSNAAAIPKKFRMKLHEQRKYYETRHEGQVAKYKESKDCWVDKRNFPWSLLPNNSLPSIAHSHNRPLWVCDRLAALVCNIPYGDNFTSRERLAMLSSVDKLTNYIGQCERIHQTAVPLNYARHSLRSLTIWLFTLPFALVDSMGMFTAVANTCISWLFFGVYQIGYSIEDPFQGSLRLSTLCDVIRRNVLVRSRDSAYNVDDNRDRIDLTPGLKSLMVGNSSPKLVRRENGTWSEVGI